MQIWWIWSLKNVILAHLEPLNWKRDTRFSENGVYPYAGNWETRPRVRGFESYWGSKIFFSHFLTRNGSRRLQAAKIHILSANCACTPKNGPKKSVFVIYWVSVILRRYIKLHLTYLHVLPSILRVRVVLNSRIEDFSPPL